MFLSFSTGQLGFFESPLLSGDPISSGDPIVLVR